MATKPRVHEIFSNQALDKSTNFKYEKQETFEKTQLPQKSKKGLAPQPPTGMKKFGGYKPKILSGGQDDIVDIQNLTANLTVDATPPAPSGKSLPAPRPPVELTKPKPWVVGDKNIPMVLGGRDRDDWGGQHVTGLKNNGHSDNESGRPPSKFIDGPVEVHLHNGIGEKNDSPEVARRSRPMSESSIVSDTSTLVRSSGTGHELEGLDNPALGSLDSLAFTSDNNNNKGNGKDKSAFEAALDATGLAHINGSFTPPLGDSQIGSSVDSDPHIYEEPVIDDTSNVYIPEPDYDEDEQTLDFTSEETSDEDGGEKRGREELRPGVRHSISSQSGNNVYSIPQYDGEDLSHYLSDDEADGLPVSPFENPLPSPTYNATTNGKTKYKKSVSKKSKSENFNPRPKLSQKHSLFKESASTHGTLPSSKSKKRGKSGKNGTQPPMFNSVRNFSYADSKYGTKGRAGGRDYVLSPGGIWRERTFSSESEPLDDSDMFLSANAQHSSYESFLRSRHGQSMPTDSNDSGVEMAEDASGEGTGVWKRLTWRLKNRNSKNYSMVEY